MTNWIHELGREWGHWMRKADALAGNLTGTLGRVYEEGPAAAAIRTAYQRSKIPLVEFPQEVDRFHKAWLQLPEDPAEILFIEYKLRVPFEEKWRLANKKKGAYYRARSDAQLQIAERLNNFIPE